MDVEGAEARGGCGLGGGLAVGLGRGGGALLAVTGGIGAQEALLALQEGQVGADVARADPAVLRQGEEDLSQREGAAAGIGVGDGVRVGVRGGVGIGLRVGIGVLAGAGVGWRRGDHDREVCVSLIFPLRVRGR